MGTKKKKKKKNEKQRDDYFYFPWRRNAFGTPINGKNQRI